jgi:hemerythrin-like domain-containing protein
MFFNRQTSLRLHEEHLATVQLWGRMERAVSARAPDEEVLSLCRECSEALAQEVARHFELEENELFSRLAAAGDAGIAALLAEEHDTIRRVAAEFDAQLKAGATARLRALGLELAERLVAHVQKEEMALLPALEDLLDEETDRELALAYAQR